MSTKERDVRPPDGAEDGSHHWLQCDGYSEAACIWYRDAWMIPGRGMFAYPEDMSGWRYLRPASPTTDAELAAAREEIARLREAATKLLESADLVEANRSAAYKARNGKTISVQTDNGERVDLVHSDNTFGLAMAAIEMRSALNASATKEG
ncbi:MAG TPA: hypothetical protein VFG62_25950 [Rhodopila sp.]|nr:hypothetical protein [Rhodopila sp.]